MRRHLRGRRVGWPVWKSDGLPAGGCSTHEWRVSGCYARDDEAQGRERRTGGDVARLRQGLWRPMTPMRRTPSPGDHDVAATARQILRSTVVTRPRIVASSPGMGS